MLVTIIYRNELVTLPAWAAQEIERRREGGIDGLLVEYDMADRFSRPVESEAMRNIHHDALSLVREMYNSLEGQLTPVHLEVMAAERDQIKRYPRLHDKHKYEFIARQLGKDYQWQQVRALLHEAAQIQAEKEFYFK